MDTNNRRSLFQIWEDILGLEIHVSQGILAGLQIGAVLLVAVLLIMLGMATAHAGKKPEQGDVNQHNQQWSHSESRSNADASASVSAQNTAVNEGVSQSVIANYEDRALKTVLGSAYADSDPGSTAPCLTSKRGIGVLGVVSLSGKTEINQECLEEHKKQKAHEREMDNARRKLQGSIELADRFKAMGRPDLATAILCVEAGMPGCTYDEEKIQALGGNKDVENMRHEISQYREEQVHGDIEK